MMSEQMCKIIKEHIKTHKSLDLEKDIDNASADTGHVSEVDKVVTLLQLVYWMLFLIMC